MSFAGVGGPGPGEESPLEACVRRLGGSSDLPGFARHIEELRALTANDRASLWEVADAILKNVSLTSKVLRVVNSIHYNRIGEPILSVSRAVSLIGVRGILDLAASILLFEHFSARGSGARELVLLSLLTANHARQAATEVGYPRTEEAYLCGMFRGLGELLVACYMPTEYAEILAEMSRSQATAREAALHVLRFSYEDLARAMVRNWKLGDRVAAAIRTPESVDDRPRSPDEMLALITTFSHELSNCVYRLGPEEGQARLQSLMRRFGPGVSLSPTAMDAFLTAALTETRDTFAAAGVPVDGLRLQRQIEDAVGATAHAASVEAAAGPAAAEAAGAPGEGASGPARAASLSALMREMQSVVESGDPLGLNDLVLMMVEVIFRGGGFDRVLFCLLDQDRTNIQARMGAGEGAPELIARFRFPVSRLSGPVYPAITQRQDIFVERVSESRYRQSGFAATVGAASFGLCPMEVDGVVIGCFYFDRRAGDLRLDPEARQALLDLRSYGAQAAAALRHRSP